MLSGWTAGTSLRLPPQCPLASTQRGAVLRVGGGFRFCGRGRAVLRVGRKSITINGGYCTPTRPSFGLVGARDRAGFQLVLERPNRVGRNKVIDGVIGLPAG